MKRHELFIVLCITFLLFNLFTFARGEKPVDNVRCEIWAELDHQNRTLHGKETIQWLNHTADSISDVYFHLYWNAFKNEESAMMREYKESDFSGIRFRERIKDGEWGWIDVKHIALADGTDLTPTIEFMAEDQPPHPNDQTVMRVTLPRPLEPGETMQLQLDFESKIPRTNARAGYYDNSYFFGQWYPKPGVYEEGKGWNCHQYHQNSEFYADFAEFTVHMTVPREFVLGASGKEIAKKENKEKGTITYTHRQTNVHDFAWTVDPDYIKIERDFIADKEVTADEYGDLARRLQLPVEQIKLNDVKMILLLSPEHKDQADRQFKALRMALKYYGLWYGPYPYETMTLLDPPFRNDCGGMEYPTLITGGSKIFLTEGPGTPEGVIIHEFGHNFWYGLMANNEFEEAWLDEGINTYSDSKVMVKAYGPLTFPFQIAGIPYNRYINPISTYSHFLYRAAGIQIVKTDPIVTVSWKFYSPSSYGLNVYMRAATCLHTLERILGEDLMIRVLRTFQMEYRYKHPNTNDFIETVNRVSGKDMTWFFDQLFFHTLEFDYGIASVISEELTTPAGVFDKEDGKKTEITWQKTREIDENKEKQYLSIVNVRRYGEATLGGDVKLKVRIVFEDGKEETRFWDGNARWIRYKFTRPYKIKFAQVDPENRFLIDADFTNNSRKRKPDAAGAKRWTNKLHFWIQNLLQVFSIIS
jgi:hypothetical protein